MEWLWSKELITNSWPRRVITIAYKRHRAEGGKRMTYSRDSHKKDELMMDCFDMGHSHWTIVCVGQLESLMQVKGIAFYSSQTELYIAT